MTRIAGGSRRITPAAEEATRRRQHAATPESSRKRRPIRAAGETATGRMRALYSRVMTRIAGVSRRITPTVEITRRQRHAVTLESSRKRRWIQAAGVTATGPTKASCFHVMSRVVDVSNKTIAAAG
jgi:hypothetical protein